MSWLAVRSYMKDAGDSDGHLTSLLLRFTLLGTVPPSLPPDTSSNDIELM